MKQFIIGSDEVGYGSYAGPIVVCAIKASFDWKIEGLRDSKKLSPKKREVICEKLNALIVNQEIKFALAQRDNLHIDRVGIAVALKECYVECFRQLYDKQSSIIVDGNLKFSGLGIDDYDIKSIIKADDSVPMVMAASCWAKVYRDALLVKLHEQYPIYDWKSNKGYGTPKHKAALEQYGVSPFHRMSYAPMKNMKHVQN